jgi:hypothetical protein
MSSKKLIQPVVEAEDEEETCEHCGGNNIHGEMVGDEVYRRCGDCSCPIES